MQTAILRTGPTQTSSEGDAIDVGETVNFSDKIELQNASWGKVANTEHQFLCIHEGDIIFCAELIQLPDTEILEKLLLWARIQGFKP
jgi:hypothetical protein